MQYKPKDTSKTTDNSPDIETLLRYKRRGIAIGSMNEKILLEAGRSNVRTDAKIHEDARQAVSEKLQSSKAGNDAIAGGYYSELLDYWHKQALTQLMQGYAVFLEAPDPIPPDWLKIGKYRLEVMRAPERNSGAAKKPKAPLNPGLDEYLSQQRA